MSSITTALPLEIIEHILDIVARSDRRIHCFKPGPDLKACSLTCQMFRRRSQQHVFRSVKLYHVDRSSQYPGHPRVPLASKFANLITNKPEIATYVRELHYVLQNVQSDDSPPFPVPTSLASIKNLETLALYPERGEFRWKDVHSSPHALLLKLMYLPSIVSIKLKLIRGFTAYDLFPCTNLKTLHIQSVSLADIIQLPLFRRCSKPLKLRELEIDFSGALTVLDIIEDGFIDNMPLLNLKFLERMTINHRNFKDLSSMEKLLEFTKNLERIHCIGGFGVILSRNFEFNEVLAVVRFLDDVGPVFSSFSGSLGSLKRLDLDIYVDRPDRDLDPLCGIPMGLQRISGINSIESLNIRIQLSRDTKHILGNEWHALEEVVLGPGWPSLRRFQLGIFSENSKNHSWLTNMRALPYTQLSALRSSAFLNFRFCVATGTRISPSVVDQSMQLSF